MDTPVNPFKALRERKGLTLHTIAVRAKVSRYLVIRTEQGCFPDPPPKLKNYFVTAFDQDPWELNYEYHQFQRQTRELNGRFLGEFPTDSLPHTEHPFTYWRSKLPGNDYNLTEVSKWLCIAQPVVYHFEHYPRQQGSVPAQLLLALEHAGYTLDEVNALTAAYADYRRFLKERPRSLAS